jgi:hypothetical protein
MRLALEIPTQRPLSVAIVKPELITFVPRQSHFIEIGPVGNLRIMPRHDESP